MHRGKAIYFQKIHHQRKTTDQSQKKSTEEIKQALSKVKRNKAPGPDGIGPEILKELDEDGISELAGVLNKWFQEEHIPEDMLKAKVVLIFKKGSTDNLANYRPISLLNSIYKIYAAIIQNRVEQGIDDILQETQFGFRKKRGTDGAIHCIRRAIVKCVASGTEVFAVLLDWEKAFDKISREAMFEAFERFRMPPKMQKVLKSFFANTRFAVEMEGKESEWLEQKTGVRQGCPLSPYLFLIVISAMFYDVHQKTNRRENKFVYRVEDVDLDEVLYADDTILVSTSTQEINAQLEAIESIGLGYGMKLNKNKFEIISTAQSGEVHFRTGQKVMEKANITYLGCRLNRQSSVHKEVNARISEAMATLKKLDLLWRLSDCPVGFKIMVHNAVIKSKLLYSLKSAQLTEATRKRLDVFQLKGLRKILGVDTTYVNRSNMNANVLRLANEKIKREGIKNKQIEIFSETYKKQRMRWLQKIFLRRHSDPVRRITLCQNSFACRSLRKKRVGRPRHKWIDEVVQDFWSAAREERIQSGIVGEYNEHLASHREVLAQIKNYK